MDATLLANNTQQRCDLLRPLAWALKLRCMGILLVSRSRFSTRVQACVLIDQIGERLRRTVKHNLQQRILLRSQLAGT